MTDPYQPRYELHQKFGKKQELIALMKERHSNRRFNTDMTVSKEIVEELLECVKHCPSSCDRHGVRIRIVTERNEKDLLDGLLVGGTGWVYRAPYVFLLMADPVAYKADGGRELEYNAYIDAGVMLQQLSLMATAEGLHCAIINPNIRDENKAFFYERFTPEDWKEGAQFCGAFVFGYPHQEPIEKHRNLIDDMEIK
jgi:nitroreductase